MDGRSRGTADAIDRRAEPRTPVALRVGYGAEMGGSYVSGQGTSVDVSAGGLCLRAQHRIPDGAVVVLRVELPDEVSLAGLARVVTTRVEGEEVLWHLAFDGLGAAGRRRLEQALTAET